MLLFRFYSIIMAFSYHGEVNHGEGSFPLIPQVTYFGFPSANTRLHFSSVLLLFSLSDL